MSTISHVSPPSPVSNLPHPPAPVQEGFDKKLADLIMKTGQVAAFPLTINSWVIDKLGNLPEAPVLNLPFVKNFVKAITRYHLQIFISTSQWSQTIGRGFADATAYLLKPLACHTIGKALQTTISETIVGNMARTVSFCAMQFFHTIPYIISAAILLGGVYLYQKAMVAMNTLLLGAILLTQLYLVLRLVNAVEAAPKTLKKQIDELIGSINVVQIITNTIYASGQLVVAPLYWLASKVHLYNPSKEA